MHDEGLKPLPQSYEFTSQLHHQDYGYNPQFFNISGEEFMSSLIGTHLRTPEFIYTYMQSMPIPLFASFHQTIANNSSTNQPIINDFV